LLGGQLQTPQSAVERAVQVMGGKEVLEQIVTMQGRERRTTFHLTDSDHPEQPFLVDYAEVGFYTDFAHERMVSQSDAQIANGDHQTATVIYRASAAETRCAQPTMERRIPCDLFLRRKTGTLRIRERFCLPL
jgi:hypothetical protein